MSRKSIYSDYNLNQDSKSSSVISSTTRLLGRKSRILLNPIPRFQPTYRLKSSNPFNRERCENIINRLMSKFIETYKYTAKSAQIHCQNISQEINRRLKLCNYDRYRLICVVTIGEKSQQSCKCVAKFLWDPETDTYTNITYESSTCFVTVTVFALYYN